MEQIVPPRTSLATAGERVQLLKIFKGPCQHHLIFPLFWWKPCEGTGFPNLPPRVYELSQEEVAIPKCQMLFFGDARNLLLAVRQAQVSDIYFYVFRRYLSLQWLSPPIKPEWFAIQISLFLKASCAQSSGVAMFLVIPSSIRSI